MNKDLRKVKSAMQLSGGKSVLGKGNSREKNDSTNFVFDLSKQETAVS